MMLNKKIKIVISGLLCTVLWLVTGCGTNSTASNVQNQAPVTAEAPKDAVQATANATVDLHRVDPPAEAAQIPKGNMTDPEYLRTLAAWYENHPKVMEFFKNRDNPNNLPMDYCEDGRPVPH